MDDLPIPGFTWSQAVAVAQESPNRVRQVGAVITTRGGLTISACNTFPDGVRDLPERHEGDGRFVWMEHAERNAILQAARRGIATQGAHITSTFHPCIDCARAIVVAGFACLDTMEPDFADITWGSHFERSSIILREGGVTVRYVAPVPSPA